MRSFTLLVDPGDVYPPQVPRPKQNVVGTKWVFHNKQDEHGVVTRNKARLVAKGYPKSQVWTLKRLLLLWLG